MTGVTVLLSAMTFHLLDIKSCHNGARQVAVMDRFHQCMLVLEKLRETYALADLATQFVEVAIRKMGIDIRCSSLRGNKYHTYFEPAMPGNKAKGMARSINDERRTRSPTEATSFKAENQTIYGWRSTNQIDYTGSG